MKQTLCHTLTISGFKVSLVQNGHNRFMVQYGKQVRMELSYEEAAAEYGASIMHALACAGKIDNELPGEE